MKITVFTGTRAEYGLLTPLLKRLNEDPEITLTLLVTGSHLSERHGHTIDEIKADGFPIGAEVPLPLEDDSETGVSKAMATALEGCATALGELRPDLLVLLGDRYECLACATSASLVGVPVAHLYGGEITQGAIDDQFRHAITKLSHLHFTSCEAYRKRVIQMGEHPDTVFNVGALGVENIKTLPLMDKEELGKNLDFPLGDKCLLLTYHPATLEADNMAGLEAFFSGLETVLDEDESVTAIITGANADPGGSAVDARAARTAEQYPKRTLVTPSLGLIRYLSAMHACAAVVGNSSSGILEAPSFGVPTVNVGTRQQGREQADSIFDCAADMDEVANTIRYALSPQIAHVVKQTRNPYEKYGTSKRIHDALIVGVPTLAKSFCDLEYRLPQDKE